jgi:hypothetical protein
MTRILVLGAGFGGLELCTLLSEALQQSNSIVPLLISGLPKANGTTAIIMITAYRDAETTRRPLENSAEALLTRLIDFSTLRSEMDPRVSSQAPTRRGTIFLLHSKNRLEPIRVWPTPPADCN